MEAAGITVVAGGDADPEAILRAVLAGSPLDSPPGCAAVAVWDDPRRTLLLARDRTGLHPLFVAAAAGAIAAGSSLDAVAAAAPDARAEPSRVAAWLVGAPLEPSETLLAGVERVPAGHVLELVEGSRRLRRSWSPPPAGQLPAHEAARFPEVLEEAVARHAGTGHAAVFLSGGVDSGCVAAATARVTARSDGEAPIALTVEVAGATEEPTQAAVTSSLGLPRLAARASADTLSLAEALDRARAATWPVTTPWTPVFDSLAVAARASGVSILVDGQGGDELLDAGPLAARVLLRDPVGLLRWMGAEYRLTGSWRAAAGAFTRVGPRVSALPPSLVPDPALRRAVVERFESRVPAGYAAARAADVLDAMLAAHREETFSAGMQIGLAHRHPLWDDRVVSLLHGLPPRALVAGGHPKSPARAYLAVHVPELRGPWPRPALADSLLGEALRGFSGPTALPLLGQLGVVAANHSFEDFPPQLRWASLALEHWLHAANDRRGAACDRRNGQAHLDSHESRPRR